MKPKGKRIVLSTGAVAAGFLALAIWLGWPHLVFWYQFAPLGLNARGYPEYRHRQTGIVFVRLPGGKFWMGAQKTDPNGQNCDPEALPDEGPVHEVTLSPFLIGKFEVTQAEWKAAMGSNPSGFKGDEARPVENVSWDDIQGFEAKTGLRLPTEAQWEYACRATTTTPIAGTGNLDDMGWYDENSGNTTHPVGQKAPNGFGLHDTHGNVWEWCEDIHDEKFYSKPEASEMNPICQAGSEFRVVRGGGWPYDAGVCRSAYRDGFDPASHGINLGFRLARSSP
jgi:formylglycine-generating enzyme required for sulfatase activity